MTVQGARDGKECDNEGTGSWSGITVGMGFGYDLIGNVPSELAILACTAIVVFSKPRTWSQLEHLHSADREANRPLRRHLAIDRQYHASVTTTSIVT
jgi:hypothetical protein